MAEFDTFAVDTFAAVDAFAAADTFAVADAAFHIHLDEIDTDLHMHSTEIDTVHLNTALGLDLRKLHLVDCSDFAFLAHWKCKHRKVQNTPSSNTHLRNRP